MAFEADPEGFAAALRRPTRRRWPRRIAAARASADRRACCRDGELLTHRRALRGVRGRRHARRPRDRAHRRRARRLARVATEVTQERHPGRGTLALPHRRRRNPFDASRAGRTAARRGAGPGRRARPTRARARPRPGSAGERGESPASRRPTGRPPRQSVLGGTRPNAPPVATFRTAALGGARGRGGRTGPTVAGSTATGTHGSAPAEPDVGHGAAPVRRPSAAAAGRQQRRRSRLRLAAADLRLAVREGRESNLVLFCRRRLGLDGRARPDGGGQGRRAVAAARRLPAPRQGRPDHLPRQRRRPGAAARPRRSTSRPHGWRGCRHRRADPAGRGSVWRRATSCVRERLRDPRAAPAGGASPTAGRPAGPTRGPHADAPRPAGSAEGAAAVVVDCETGRCPAGSGRASGRAPRCAIGAGRRSCAADSLTAVVSTPPPIYWRAA